MVKPFEEAAFSLEKEEVSGLVESRFGFHIIKVLDIAEESVKPLAEVKSAIKSVLQDEISSELAEARAEDIYYEALKDKTLENIANEEKLGYKKTALFTLDEIPEELRSFSGTVHEASTMEPGWTGRPVESGKKYYIITMVEKESPREPGFEEVKDRVGVAVTKELAAKAAREMGEKVLKEAIDGIPVKKILKKYNLKAEETGHFSRARNFVPKIGVSEEIVNRAFELEERKPIADQVYEVADNTVIFRLKERKEIDMELFAKEKETFRTGLINRKKGEVYINWLEETRRKAKIEYHEDLMDVQG